MSTYRCLVVDDEDLARELIETHLSQLENFELVASCASAIEASAVLKEHQVDLMFLDIEMPVLKGTDFYKNLLNKPKVIFTTAYRDYAVDGFELDAVDYLLKPIVFARFFQAIERFLAGAQNSKPTPLEQPVKLCDHIFVRKDRKQIKIELDNLLYVQGLKDYIQIFLHDNTTHIIKQSMSAFEQQLGTGFIRTHRSYIVNLSKITALTKHDIELGDIEIPIGDNYKTALFSALDT